MARGELNAPDALRAAAVGSTFVLTSAQSNTKLHEEFWQALLVYCKENSAELHVSRYTYNKDSLGGQDEKPGADDAEQEVWFDPKLDNYVSDESLQLAPTLVWCGELNVIPTKVNPISGFQHYTRLNSCVIPHAKMAMESVANMKYAESKQVFTTGTVTQRNYIQKAAGQKAEFHHVFGAIVVEVAEDGTWWARQLNADSEDGSFYDLNKKYSKSGVSKFKRVQAITHGDIHGLKCDPLVIDAVFREDGIVDTLRPREQFFHDLVDFMPRNHHNMKDPHHFYRMHQKGTESVEAEFDFVAQWISRPAEGVPLAGAYRKWCDTFVVVSNHDQAIETWLRDTSAVMDPPNVVFWHTMNLAMLSHINTRETHAFEYALRRSLAKIPGGGARIRVLQEDDSYRILEEIEAALHGHLGSNGSRGSPRSLRGAGKANTGHTHSPGIFEGVYTAGVYGRQDMGYNKGLSSWSNSMIVTYPNAKRAILTIKNGKAWR